VSSGAAGTGLEFPDRHKAESEPSILLFHNETYRVVK
jgi:hypothetical protein